MSGVVPWMNFKGQTALVTGGARGIGRQIAIDLARCGAFVIINYKSDDDAATETFRTIVELGGDGALLKFDVSDSEQVDKNVNDILQQRKSIEILVNNAGIARDGLVGRMKDVDWNDVLNTNLTGAFNMCRMLTKSMIRKRYGRIVNISSAAGELGNAGQANYSAAKAGLIGLTKALARELAPRNILINCVTPGMISGGMSNQLNPEQVDAILKHVPLGRFGTPEDVAACVVFLCSDMANYITGQVFRINGGLYM
ncbi:MAG: 3-oxoacyl-[acyl-carrier-protein] reductase [Deltaproteobacteria bacterium]|nr:3-oxoacyl-[acyl-carrier-protein] reductase [Deltaproteobacteria bacterium]